MADQVITKQELIDAQKDAQTLEDAVNGEPGKLIKSRTGREFYSLASVPQINTMTREEVTAAVAPKADKTETAAALDTKANQADTFLKSEVTGLVAPKADKTYVDSAVGAISTDASKQYATLALAEADIANIALNKNIFVSEAANGGYWYKATPDATNLTKSPFDPVEKSKEYTNAEVSTLNKRIAYINVGDLLHGIKDPNNKLAPFPQTGLDGNPTPMCAESIHDSIEPKIIESIVVELEKLGYSIVISDDYILQFVDKYGRRSCLEIGKNGLWSEWAIDCIKKQLTGAGFGAVPAKYKSTYNSSEINIVSGSNISCYGDSMTYGATSDGNPYTKFLQEKLINIGSNAEVFNFGVGGETSPTICARQGGNPFVLTFDDGSIPTTTTATRVTLLNINGAVVRPMIQHLQSYDGYLTLKDGTRVAGTIAIVKPNGSSASWDNANYYTFKRKTAGTAITVDRPSAFYLDLAEQHLSDIHIIWIGQNNFADNARAIADAKAMIQRMKSLDKRFIVMSKPGGTSAQDTDDAVWFAEFGRRFIPIRQYLVQYGLSDAGITPTTQDLIDISNGTVPTSLRNDSVHFKPIGYQIVANVIFSRLAELGWI